jgi:hypothetical protein
VLRQQGRQVVGPGILKSGVVRVVFLINIRGSGPETFPNPDAGLQFGAVELEVVDVVKAVAA